MPIIWNKVTWYSQVIAIILFVVVLIIGFYFGKEYQKILDDNNQANYLIQNK
jgi:hypothetical protein